MFLPGLAVRAIAGITRGTNGGPKGVCTASDDNSSSCAQGDASEICRRGANQGDLETVHQLRRDARRVKTLCKHIRSVALTKIRKPAEFPRFTHRRAATVGTFPRRTLPHRGLSPGLYRVRLDPQSLPIELVPTGESLWVKVSHGAVTEVNFLTELQFGVAGRVTREDGSFVARSKLWILDDDGDTRVSTYTDQFGLYRADGLTPGRYRVEVVGDDAQIVSAATEFQISDDFLFGVDLTLPELLENKGG